MTLRVWFKKVPQLGDMVQINDTIAGKTSTICFDGNIRMLARTFQPNENWAMNRTVKKFELGDSTGAWEVTI